MPLFLLLFLLVGRLVFDFDRPDYVVFCHGGSVSVLVSYCQPANMADYNYGGSEEENAELKKLEVELV